MVVAAKKDRMSTSEYERDKRDKLREKADREWRNVLGKAQLTELQMKILKNVRRLSEYLQTITKAALASRDTHWQRELLADIQRIGKQAAAIIKKIQQREAKHE